MITGAKTSNQLTVPKITLMIKSIAVNSIPNEINTRLKPILFFLLLLLATRGSIFMINASNLGHL